MPENPTSWATFLLVFNSAGLGGLGIALFFAWKALNNQIKTLQATLDAAKQRADEFEKLSEGYKKAVDDFNDMGEKLQSRREAVVREYEKAMAEKDEKLAEYKQKELEQIQMKEESYKNLNDLTEKVEDLAHKIDQNLKILSNDFTSNVIYDSIRSRWAHGGGLFSLAFPPVGTTKMQTLAERLATDFQKKSLEDLPADDEEKPKDKSGRNYPQDEGSEYQ